MPDQRLYFSKMGTARYISHLDLMRTFQRAFLRAGIPIRHTQGFNPHAYVSILLPLPVGFSSTCEILEFGLLDGTSVQEVPARLRDVLPAGVEVRHCRDAVRPAKELAFVKYIVTLEYENGVPGGAAGSLRELFQRDSLLVDKRSKKAKSGRVEVDIIPQVHSLNYEECGDAVTIGAVLRARNPGLNPGLLLAALSRYRPELAPDFVSYHRKAVLDGQLKTFE